MVRTREPSPSRVRYRAQHRAISVQVTNAEYVELDNIRKIENMGWRDILRRSLQVPSTEEGKFTLERCIAAENKIKTLEAELENPKRYKVTFLLCTTCGIRKPFDIRRKEDLAEMATYFRDGRYCPDCKTPAGPRSPAPNRRY
jgi:hypothetical protein